MHDSESRVPIQASGSTWSLAEVTSQHPWCEAARTRLGKSGEVPTTTIDVVRELAAGWERDHPGLAGDPWLDLSFAERFTTRVRWVVGLIEKAEHEKKDTELALSSAEASVLVVFPYLHQAFWARQAATTLQGTPPADAAFSKESPLPDFRKFVADHGTLHRRGTLAFESGDDAANHIAWWLFHRWLVRRSACYSANTVAALLPGILAEPLRSVFTPERLTEMMRVVQIDPAFLRRTDRRAGLKPIRHLGGGSDHEEDLREQLLGYLLLVAHRTAIDPMTLSRDIIDHIGIKNGVTPDEALTSVRAVQWNGKRTRQLDTTCSHPATVLALRHQAAVVDTLLREVDRAADESESLKPLKNLPRHATADGVDSSASVGHRFSLADDRIQELLMGEQLYGTPDLAIRELYQNALDACRYRDARTRFLTKTGTCLPPWTGQIHFHQDVDDRGPYLECEDNGIGMGDRELIDVFSRAGVRLSDLPEYIEEQADWEGEGIKCYPNSRFGIGVLSYFMLADEITVTTCRLDRDGRPGQRLRVHIAGPGALFRVELLGQGEDAGTTVRLRLRSISKPVHCTDLLRRILWISDYLVTSDDSSGQQTWSAHELSRMAPIGAADPLTPGARRTANHTLPVPGGTLWWCDTAGAVLADGIWAGSSLYGAIVNLTGPALPRLTVDRRRIIELDLKSIDDRLRAAIPTLLGSTRLLSHSWLCNIAEHRPRLADDICERAIETKYRPWRVGEIELPIEAIGCFPPDEIATNMRTEARSWSDRIARWRLAAWLQAHPRPDLPFTMVAAVPALPSDEILLSAKARQAPDRPDWLSDKVSPALGHILSVALKAQRSPTEVATRLDALGYPVPAPDTLPVAARATDPLLLSKSCAGEPPWLAPDDPVPHGHVLLAAISAEMTPLAVAERLIELGYHLLLGERIPTVVHSGDRRLLQHLGGQSPPQPLRDNAHPDPLPVDETVPVAHLYIAASVTGRTPAEVARRLSELGYAMPEQVDLSNEHNNHDATIFINRTGGYVPNPVPLHHIVIAAIESKRSPTEVAERLAGAGLEVPADDELPNLRLPLDDLLTQAHSITGPNERLRYHEASAGIAHVLCAAMHTGLSPADVALRLSELGYAPPAKSYPTEIPTRSDLLLLNSSLDYDSFSINENQRISEWLPQSVPVPVQHIAIAAAKTQQSPVEVARKLRSLGFETPSEHRLCFHADPDDAVLLSLDTDGIAPWLHTDYMTLIQAKRNLPLGFVLAAASRLGKAPAEVAGRLEVLGIQAERAPMPVSPKSDDHKLLDRTDRIQHGPEGQPKQLPWIGSADTVTRSHVVIVAGMTGQPPAAAAQRLTELGILIEDFNDLPPYVTQSDLTLLALDADGQRPFRNRGNEFPLSQVMAAATTTRSTPAQVVERIFQLGFTFDV